MNRTKKIFVIFTITAALLVGNVPAIKTPATVLPGGGSQGLDLNAVAELLTEANNLEEFEKSLNDLEKGINNLDLDENEEVDYIRVEEQVTDDTHLIVLQTHLTGDEVQDVATIAFDKEDEEKFNMQIQGDPEIYGENYYFVPVQTNVGAWPLIRWIYRPGYKPHRSIFGFRVYPRWWQVRRPVAPDVYRTRTVYFVGRKNFVASKTVRVKTVGKVSYQRRTSTLVKKKKVVVNGNKTVVTKSVKKTNNGRKTKVRRN